jgi:hypothetical protein
MEVDYSPFLSVRDDGKIWWQLTDAVKLGAGYLPLRDDDRDLVPVLRANTNRVRANERTLLAEFSPAHYSDAHPRIRQSDNIRFVEAQEFLAWLSQYVAIQPAKTVQFPMQLASAVQTAMESSEVNRTNQLTYRSLTAELEDWFEFPLGELPEPLRERVKKEFLISWDSLGALRRRTVAEQWDYQRDPATETDRKNWWEHFQRINALEEQIRTWEQVATPTAADLRLQETRLMTLREELAELKAQERLSDDNGGKPGKPSPPDIDRASGLKPDEIAYVAYPRALRQLTDKYGTTPEELAAWVHAGPADGGLAAYLSANELDPPPRFAYAVGTESFDYVRPLVACWFRVADIETFVPKDRYITGATLLDRWSKVLGQHTEAFVRAKIGESRLIDIHPFYGGTQGTFSEQPKFPPLASGLFVLAHVEQVETDDFGSAPGVTTIKLTSASPEAPVAVNQDEGSQAPDEGVTDSPTSAVGSPEWRKQNARTAANARHGKPGGNRDKNQRIRELWASGKYSSRQVCADQESEGLGMSFDAARRALRNTPKPDRTSKG